MNYGVSYKGSKSRIADRLTGAVPYVGVEHFYDLFCGGCAVSHRMLLEKRYGHIHCNDLNGMALLLFVNGIKGEYKSETRWISREDFIRLRDTDPYVSCCWSFGNNQRDYLYSRKIEPYKKACHYAIVLDDFTLLGELCPEVADACAEVLEGVSDTHERRIKFGPTVVNWLKAHGTPEMVANNPLYSSCHVRKDTKTRPKGAIRDMERLERLESLERIERVNNIRYADTNGLTWSIGSYDEVKIMPKSVIYADIPYRSTNAYGSSKNKITFDYDKFYAWCESQTELVLISEHWMPEDRFVSIWETKHIQSICSSKTSAVTERLFVPKHQLGLYRSMMDAHKEKTLFD